MIAKLQPDSPVCAISSASWNEMADKLNNSRGANGCRVETDANGGLVVRLGDDQYAWRTITTVELTHLEDGTPALAMRAVRVLCALPQQDTLQIVPFSATQLIFNESDELTGIKVNGVTVAVEPCDGA